MNSVPDYAEFDIDIRTIPSQDHGGIRSHLEDYMQENIELEATVDVNGVISNFSDAWIQDVIKCVGAITGETSGREAANYFTDASVLAPAFGNPPTIIIGPGDATVAHKTDEYCELEKLYQSVDIYETMIKRWCTIG